MSLPLKWEFPGGKIESNESPESCIVREIQEELNITICPIRQLADVTYQNENFSIVLIPFVCKMVGGDLSATEHTEIRWLTPNELPQLDWAQADQPIVDEIKNWKLC
jgi:8-oxo-dGTP diphosphatase